MDHSEMRWGGDGKQGRREGPEGSLLSWPPQEVAQMEGL